MEPQQQRESADWMRMQRSSYLSGQASFPAPTAACLTISAVTLLDTRTAGEYKRGHIDGFRNIPVDELRQRLEELDPGKPVYVICQSGLRSYIASRILEGNGFTAYNFSGGFRFYDAVMNDRALIETAYACGMDQ